MEKHPLDTDCLLRLLLGELTGENSESEKTQLQHWLKESPENETLYKELQEEVRLQQLYQEQQQFQATTGLERISKRMNVAKISIFRRWLPYAAAVVLVVLVGVWIYVGNEIADRRPANGQGKPNAAHVVDIQPGSNRATLTLADGSTVDLSEAQSGIIAGDKITYLDGSTVFGEQVNKSTREQGHDGLRTEESASQAHKFTGSLQLTTPKGGTYQITLPDGSKVWLNAGTTLKYPSRFSSEERVVELSGEAYFEVAKAQNWPFRVVGKNQVVDVLGTAFNITAYPDETETTTTLVEGRVKVVVDGITASILNPGDQSTLRKDGIAIKAVDVSSAVAWRNGRFAFDNKTFSQIMNELARWYNLDIVYKNGIPQEELVGDAFRNQNLGLVLRVLDAVEIDYRLDVANRKLIISGKKTRSAN